MPVSLDELINATQYRSLSRTGRTTDSVSSKARAQFQQSIIRRRTAVEDAAAGKKADVNPLKLLTVAEVVDTEGEALRLSKALPAELVDERVDVLVSSAREHPEVARKGQYIVTLEKEIAFHSAMATFHGGVDTDASLQSADVVARKHFERERHEQDRRNQAFDAAGSTSGSPKKGKKIDRQALLTLQTEALTSPVKQRANTPSPAFASKSSRFEVDRSDRAPPVGHYRPRHNAVDAAPLATAFPKNPRVLNSVIPSPYKGDMMTLEEREQLIMSVSRPGTVAAQAPSTPVFNNNASLMKSSLGKSAGDDKALVTPPGSPKALGGSPPGTASSPFKSSPCFLAPGRDSVAMTRGGAGGGGESPASSLRASRAKSPPHDDRPATVNDLAIRKRATGTIDMSLQLSRTPISVSGMSALTDTTKMPLRTGVPLSGFKHVLSFDAHASRDQRARPSEPKAESLAQRFYDRSAIDRIKYSRTPTLSFESSPGRTAIRSPDRLLGTENVDSRIPEMPRSHMASFRMELSPSRHPIELPFADVDYEPRDDIIRPTTRHTVISPARSSQRSPPPSPSIVLPSSAESPVTRRKLTHDIDLAKQITRDAASRVGRGGGVQPGADGPDPIPSERLGRATEFTRPHAKGLIPMSTVVSREQRDKVGSPEHVTLAVDTRAPNAENASLPNMKLGYVSFGKMTDRDHHGGNNFANESRVLTKLFDEAHSPTRDRASVARSKAPSH